MNKYFINTMSLCPIEHDYMESVEADQKVTILNTWTEIIRID